MPNPFDAVFDPEHSHQNGSAVLWILGLSTFVLALNAAGRLQVGLLGLVGLLLIFMLLGGAGCYWYAASTHFLTQAMRVEHRHSKPWLISLQGLWPLILLGPGVSAQRVWPSVGLLFTLLILGGTVVTLLMALRRAYRMHWPQAALCVGLTAILGSLALLGLVGWPSMLLLGAYS